MHFLRTTLFYCADILINNAMPRPRHDQILHDKVVMPLGFETLWMKGLIYIYIYKWLFVCRLDLWDKDKLI